MTTNVTIACRYCATDVEITVWREVGPGLNTYGWELTDGHRCDAGRPTDEAWEADHHDAVGAAYADTFRRPED